METLLTYFPTADDLLAMSPDDLAPILLSLAARAGPMFWPDAVAEIKQGTGMATTLEFAYPYHKKPQINALLGEAWEKLRRDGLIMPAPDQNGRNGYMVLTKDGASISSNEDFERLRAARAFPKSLLHASIADKVYSYLMRGELDEAIKAVEVAVRAVGKFAPTDIGVPLMRKAFDPKSGPLADHNQPEAEKEALCHLFAGAIGSYKNPHSHRTVALTDAREAQQQVMLATHLLSIVDARRST
jgi:uncharacterized protein (TIGR02391 family)